VVTLTAKTGFTFAGVGTDVFSHGTITGTNSVNDGIVTFIFPTTETAPPEKGSFAISIGFNYGNITVTGDTESNTITQPSGTLQLTVTGYGEIAWYVDENISPVSTENPVTLNAADYGIGAHNVTFKGKKEGITYSKVVLFVVAAAVPPPDGALTSVQAVASYLNSAPGGGSEAEPVSLVVAINLSEGGDPTNWAALVTAIDNADKFVDLDLSGCALNGTEFDPAKDTTSLNTGKAKIVSLVLPDTATSVKQAKTYSNGSFHEFSRIKSISGSGITAIDQYVFSGHQTLTTLNLPNVTSISGTSAVRGSTALTTVNLPKLASMGSFTFQDCTALTEVDLPQLTEVATTAFQGCAELARVNIPGVTSIKVQGFAKAFKANAAVTIVMGKTAPALAGNIFYSVDSTVTVTVQVPANATGYNEAWKSDFLKGGGITSGNLSIVEQ
jgi:hypothetical protein